MKYCCYILLGLASAVFTKIGRIKPLYEVVEYLWSTIVKRTMCHLPTNAFPFSRVTRDVD